MRKLSNAMELLRAKGRPRTKADFEWINRVVARDELAQAFNLPSAAAAMLLHGLIATGNVRVLGNDNELIDIDNCAIADLEGKAASVAGDELRDWINAHSTLPQGPQGRDRLIAQKLQDGINPPRTIPWKQFCDGVRDECGGWIVTGGKRVPARGFSDKQIQRAVNDLRSN
jgi:hypothetical protein